LSALSNRIKDARKFLDWTDLIIVIGGDNIFVLATSIIMNDRIPICGINPHPITDEIFSLPMEYNVDVDRIFERFRAGNYKLLMRSRMRITMTGTGIYRRPIYVHERERTRDIIEMG